MTNNELILHLIKKLLNNNQNPKIAYYILNYHQKWNNQLDFINYRNNEALFINECIKDVDDYINGKPLARIIKSANFYKLNFNVDNKVFVPRCETEILVDKVIEILKLNNQLINLADVCCGTGIIGLTIKYYLDRINLYQNDINKLAINNTLKNAAKYHLKTKIYLSANLDAYISNNVKLDIIVSNPPYIDINSNEIGLNVNKYDPYDALFCEDNGLKVYKQILSDSIKVINLDKFIIAFEIGHNQADDIIKYAKEIYHDDINIKVIKDYSQLDRVIIISKNCVLEKGINNV